MSRNLRSYSVLALTFGWISTLAAQTTPAARILITQPIDANHPYTLAGNTRPEANPQNDRGKVADSLRAASHASAIAA